jgi:hypothetical protein
VAAGGWIAPTDPQARGLKLALANARVFGMLFVPWKVIVARGVFKPAVLLALVVLLAPTVWLVPDV